MHATNWRALISLDPIRVLAINNKNETFNFKCDLLVKFITADARYAFMFLDANMCIDPEKKKYIIGHRLFRIYGVPNVQLPKSLLHIE